MQLIMRAQQQPLQQHTHAPASPQYVRFNDKNSHNSNKQTSTAHENNGLEK